MVMDRAAQLPEGPEWQYEFAWPGERVLALKQGASVQLMSAVHRRDLTNRFPVIVAAMAKLNVNYVMLDGLIRRLEPPQTAYLGVSEISSRPRFIVSDVLWVDERDARQLSLGERRRRLQDLIAGTDLLLAQLSGGSSSEIIDLAKQVGASDIIAKRRSSRYRPFARTGDWIRINVATADARFSPFSLKSRESDPYGAGWGAATT